MTNLTKIMKTLTNNNLKFVKIFITNLFFQLIFINPAVSLSRFSAILHASRFLMSAISSWSSEFNSLYDLEHEYSKVSVECHLSLKY